MTINYRRVTYTKPCIECMKPFESVRSDAHYCSGKCRSQAKRWRDKAANFAVDAQVLLLSMRPYMKTELGTDLYPKLKLVKGLCELLMDDYVTRAPGSK
jgi:hypothetical protein